MNSFITTVKESFQKKKAIQHDSVNIKKNTDAIGYDYHFLLYKVIKPRIEDRTINGNCYEESWKLPDYISQPVAISMVDEFLKKENFNGKACFCKQTDKLCIFVEATRPSPTSIEVIRDLDNIYQTSLDMY